MVPVHPVLPVGKSRSVVIWPDGTIVFPAEVVRHLGWQVGKRIAVSYLEATLILFFSSSTDQPGFILHSIGRDTESGNSASKVRVSKLANQVIRPRIKLPVRGLEPIYLPTTTSFEMALNLEPWSWFETTFDASGAESIPARQVGLYEIMSADGRILRIGEGFVQVRCREHLKNGDLIRSGRGLRYLPLEKTDSVLLEQVALAEYRAKFGALPPFNAISQ